MPRFRLLLCLFLVPLCSPAADDFRFPEAKRGVRGELTYHHGIPVLVVNGTPEQMGEAVGELAIKTSKRPLDYPKDLLEAYGATKFWNMFVNGGKGMYQNFPVAYQTELKAMAKTSDCRLDDLIVGNTIFDLKKIFACSSLLVEPSRSSTGGPLMGRNLDYPSLGYIHEYSLVTVYRPKGKHAFASVGFPGLMGVVSGMNDSGLALAILEVAQVKEGEPRYNPTGLPYALCFRKVLEECATIAEAKKLLERLPRTAILNLVVADRNDVAVFEISPKRIVQRNPQDGICSCTNHFHMDELKAEKTANVARTLDRFEKLSEVSRTDTKLSPSDLRKRLHAVNLGTMTLQTMVFEPRTLRLHLSIGSVPASANPFATLELAPLFGVKE